MGSHRIVIEIPLDPDDRGALVSAAAGQIAERADQIGQAAGRGALGHHIAHQVGVLVADIIRNGFLQGVARKIGEVDEQYPRRMHNRFLARTPLCPGPEWQEELFVTPRDVDSRVRTAARLVGYAVNMALHDGLTPEDIDMFLS